MKIAIACDHAGYEYKERLVKYLREKGHEVKDFGAYSAESWIIRIRLIRWLRPWRLASMKEELPFAEVVTAFL